MTWAREYTAFRAEMREWIEANVPAGLKELADWSWQPIAGGKRGAALAKATDSPIYREWSTRLLDAKLICAQWPVEFGGQGWDAVRFSVFNEELRRYGVPAVRRGMGETLVGPPIMAHGTPEQQAYFLPRIVSGEDVYCQGYSEPNHGSDLGAVETKGVVDGDELVITGPEDLDLGRAERQHDLRAVSHQPRRAQAPRPLLRPGAVLQGERRDGACRYVRCRARRGSARTSSTARGRRCST